MPDEPPRKPRLAAVRMGRGVEAAWEAALSIVVGALLGIYTDKWFDTSPILLFVFLTLGAVVAFRRLIALGKQAVKDAETPPR